jgi:ParB family chromosome partitioning protein
MPDESHLLRNLIDESRELPAPDKETEAPAERPSAPAAIEPQGPAAPAAKKIPSTPSDRPPASGLRPTHPGRQREDAIFYLETSKIRPNEHQPRKHFDEDAIRELAASIREFGILQPIVVTKREREVPSGTEVDYELIAGERRLLAAKSLGMERVPSIIRHVDLERERLELAIIENLQREDLNGIEMARAFSRLQDEFRLTQREIAARLGKSRESVANTVRLLDLPSYVQEAIETGKITESHGLFLLGVDDPALQQELFQELTDKKLTVRELRQKVQAGRRHKEIAGRSVPPEIKMFEDRLASELGAPVSIETKEGSGKITINFFSAEELENIVHRVSGPEE